MTAKKLCQSILAFKAGQVLLTRKNGVDVNSKKLSRPSLIANGLPKHRFRYLALSKPINKGFSRSTSLSRSAIGAGGGKGKVF